MRQVCRFLPVRFRQSAQLQYLFQDLLRSRPSCLSESQDFLPLMLLFADYVLESC